MTFQVRLSQLEDRKVFEETVVKYISRLKAFNFEKGKPRPTAHPLVEACIKRVQAKGKPDQFVADYEIIDDLEAPMELEQRKQLCINRLAQAENAAKEKVIPQRKIRLLNYKLAEIMKKKEEERTTEDNEGLAFAEEFRKKFSEIDRIAAQASWDIEELTEANIMTWEPPDFG